jgi:uncharacterized membrane protein YccC
MQFKPVKQLNSILTQEYFEPTISWALRVVIALNAPLILLPLWKGFSYEVIWAAFGAYMLSLIDYRGSHYRKVMIQFTETVLIVVAALIGMYVAQSVLLSISAMFIVGMFAALIRNWSDYGSSIGVAVGFFFLFGLANPVSFEISLSYAAYMFAGAMWAILITVFSFPFTASNPLRRSVAKIWKANTDFIDAIILKHLSDSDEVDALTMTQKELDVRKAINHSIGLFERRQTTKTRLKAQHYDMMMELRKTSSFFGASLHGLQEELEILKNSDFEPIKRNVLYKTLSSLAQATARISIVIFTFRGEDLTMAKIRVKRFEIAIKLFKEACYGLKLSEQEKRAVSHLIETLYKAHAYLQQTIGQIEEKLNFKKSDYLENYKLSFNHFIAGLKPRVLMEFMREMFNINSQQFRYALRVAFGLSFGVFIYKFFHIDHGHWIALTMMIVIQPYYGATRKKGLERIIGTVSGIILGGVIMLLPIPHEAFVGILVVISFFVAYFLRNNYKVGVFFVTIMMVVMMQISQQGSWELIGWRVLSTLIGAALALVAGYAFWPVWEKQRFPALLSNALAQNKNYLKQIVAYYNKELHADESWSKCRRLAEAANNDVFACVQRMYEEPQFVQRQVDISFAKVGVNIRIAREITSIALSITELKNEEPVPELANYMTQASAIFDWLVQEASASHTPKELPDFKALKESLNAPVFSKSRQLEFMKNELEKIIFELETICRLVKEQKKYA